MYPEYIKEGIEPLGKKGNIVLYAQLIRVWGVVVMDKWFYHNQLMELLDDRTTYNRF